MDVFDVILAAKGIASLLREFGLTFEDVGNIVARAQAEGREVTRADVQAYIRKRKEALKGLDAAVARRTNG